MWELYDSLIDEIPGDLVADELFCGSHKVFVRSGEGCGISSAMTVETRPCFNAHRLPGIALRELASCIKSWNFLEASLGLAAVNAYYNSLPVLKQNGVGLFPARFAEDRINDPFIAYQNQIRGKKVAVIGHFNYLDQLFAPACQLSILNYEPDDSHYPLFASEYLLPECDFVFISCNALIDKTLPRLLELSANAHVVLIGHSTPIAPPLARFGVNDLSGFAVKDPDKARSICTGQEYMKIYASGQKVSLKFQ